MQRSALFTGSLAISAFLLAAVSTTLDDFTLSGSQPNQSGTIPIPGCTCHGNVSNDYEPEFNWMGGMMSHAARDPLWSAAMAIAEQDAAFSGDLCIRCHSPKAWLEGRSVPTDGSAMTVDDRSSVNCEFCHRMVRPFPQGTNPYAGNADYTTGTYPRDTTYLRRLSQRVIHTGNGMYAVDSIDTRRGPRPLSTVSPAHPAYYSPFHRDAALCGTCHDVSNPAFTRVVDDDSNSTYILNDLDTPPASMSPHDQFPVERTYSEWSKSAYNSTTGIYAPQFGGTKSYVATCQDCHMRDVNGMLTKSKPTRTDLALHDQTGGNTFTPRLVKAKYGTEITPAALDSGIGRARYMLRNAATLEVFDELPNIRVRVTNQTGHKLPSGYPEGRRIWLNVRFYNSGDALIEEKGTYEASTGMLDKASTKVYEIKLGMTPDIASATGRANESDGSSFHFVLNNTVVKDNRIPPRGFTNQAFRQIQSPPVNATYADGQYWDDTVFPVPAEAHHYVVRLYYQTISNEYVTFLRDANTTNALGDTLYALWEAHGRSTPEMMAEATSSTPLAVNVTSFTGSWTDGSVWLRWRTATEADNRGFSIERRRVGSGLPSATWEQIGWVDGAGTRTSPAQYEFRDSPPATGRYAYRLAAVDVTGVSTAAGELELEAGVVPLSFGLDQNYPNPFNPSTRISYRLPVAAMVTVSIFDVQGRMVSRLAEGMTPAGVHQVLWNAIGSPSGVYLCRLEATRPDGVRQTATQKLLLVQ